MENINGILIIGPVDLTLDGRRKKFTEDVNMYDIAKTIKPFNEAEYVIYKANNGEIKILKYKYPILVNSSKIY